ncbi:MAG: asparagine synthase (glutamine-hydrolyzing) [Pseudomonadota bacterium]
MCGIAGLWRLAGSDPADQSRIGHMSAIMRHRGPNDFGFLLADTDTGQSIATQTLSADFVPDLLLASRRLSILDLTAAGQQPIANESGDISVVFNGAIHNYLELRRELEGFGHVFQSKTDTEIIVHAYEQWGPDCANRFNGMWAYAIWDARNQTLICSRDRFGIKPLCMARHEGGFYFASEAKSIIAAGVPAEPNPRFLRAHTTYGFFVPGDETAFSTISQVPAGHNLIVTQNSEHLSRYWSYTDQSESYDLRNPEQCFRELLDDAVRLRLRADVPIAVLLSGGLDSSAVTALAADHLGAGQVDAFTVAFPGYSKDELHHAELVARWRGVSLNVIEYDPKDLTTDLDQVTWHMDMAPAIGQLPVRWRLLKSVSQVARIVLEGQGADEMLGGYSDRYLKPYVQSELASLRPWNIHPRLTRALAAQYKRKHARWRMKAQGPMFSAEDLLSQDWTIRYQTGHQGAAQAPAPFSTALHNKLWRDHSHDWLPYLLHFGDAISMAHAVESRVPFMDHRLVEFTFALPFDQLVRGTETKSIMRRSLERDLPPEIIGRRDKIGFETPTGNWVQSQLATEIGPYLRSDAVKETGLFDDAHLNACVERAPTDRNCAQLLFQCYGLVSWFRQFVDGEGFADITKFATDESDGRPGMHREELQTVATGLKLT